MTAQPVPVNPDSRLSKSSLISFITGLIFCVPFLGVLALISGIIGFVRTGKPGVRGRWMAVVGSILGLGTTILWALGFTFFIGLILALIGASEAPRTATRDLVRALSENNIPAAKALAPSVAEKDLEALSLTVQKWGKFSDISFNSTYFDGTDVCKLGGRAEFASGPRNVTAVVEKSGGDWKVTALRFP